MIKTEPKDRWKLNGHLDFFRARCTVPEKCQNPNIILESAEIGEGKGSWYEDTREHADRQMEWHGHTSVKGSAMANH